MGPGCVYIPENPTEARLTGKEGRGRERNREERQRSPSPPTDFKVSNGDGVGARLGVSTSLPRSPHSQRFLRPTSGFYLLPAHAERASRRTRRLSLSLSSRVDSPSPTPHRRAPAESRRRAHRRRDGVSSSSSAANCRETRGARRDEEERRRRRKHRHPAAGRQQTSRREEARGAVVTRSGGADDEQPPRRFWQGADPSDALPLVDRRAFWEPGVPRLRLSEAEQPPLDIHPRSLLSRTLRSPPPPSVVPL